MFSSTVMFSYYSLLSQSLLLGWAPVSVCLSVTHYDKTLEFTGNLLCLFSSGSQVGDPLLWAVITWPRSDIIQWDVLWTQHICSHLLSITSVTRKSVVRGDTECFPPSLLSALVLNSSVILFCFFFFRGHHSKKTCMKNCWTQNNLTDTTWPQTCRPWVTSTHISA